MSRKPSHAETEALNEQTGWTPKQRNHLRRLIRQDATIAYVVTDRHGRPANGGPATREWQCRPGLAQVIPGPLALCGPGALHGTYQPHRWRGERVWVAGFVGEVARQEDKIGALHREIVGEVFPEQALDHSVGARLGRRDLYCANLDGANLDGANLYRANLDGANLYRANLDCANLVRAHLYCANLDGANLDGANLVCANLDGANLVRANLVRANLDGANLDCANLYCANLDGANLVRANLVRANLDCANLEGANLVCANLDGAYRPNAKAVAELVEAGYENDDCGYLRKVKK